MSNFLTDSHSASAEGMNTLSCFIASFQVTAQMGGTQNVGSLYNSSLLTASELS
jgi:hypothetical protein